MACAAWDGDGEYRVQWKKEEEQPSKRENKLDCQRLLQQRQAWAALEDCYNVSPSTSHSTRRARNCSSDFHFSRISMTMLVTVAAMPVEAMDEKDRTLYPQGCPRTGRPHRVRN